MNCCEAYHPCSPWRIGRGTILQYNYSLNEYILGEMFLFEKNVWAEWWWVATLPLYFVDEGVFQLFIIAILLRREIFTGQPTTTPIKFIYKNTKSHEIEILLNKDVQGWSPSLCLRTGMIGFAILLMNQKNRHPTNCKVSVFFVCNSLSVKNKLCKLNGLNDCITLVNSHIT